MSFGEYYRAPAWITLLALLLWFGLCWADAGSALSGLLAMISGKNLIVLSGLALFWGLELALRHRSRPGAGHGRHHAWP
ncbi:MULTISPECIES: hypothetical protein [Chromobacterium]|uniref:Uncharacterized protein n=1 Tax=Chromobacterium aquaticum TaxID=467180 RepID=A0ABV8ZS05_9NEIS|nr:MULTISPECIES: hypothetical protein [Chromobacterium]KMN33503.1 hypothetical protein VI26_15610 [Chromobacterium sp. LK1]MCD5363897.1 hypothetical protein [Chromobacterium aquaticum]